MRIFAVSCAGVMPASPWPGPSPRRRRRWFRRAWQSTGGPSGAAGRPRRRPTSGTTATPGLADRRGGEGSRRPRRARTPAGRRTGNRSRRCRGPQSRPLSPSAMRSRARAKRVAHRFNPGIAFVQSKRDRGLQVGRGGEGQELVRARRDAGQLRLGDHPTDFPPGQREDLARRADLDRPLGHARQRRQRREALPIEQDMLPHFVADDGEVVHRATAATVSNSPASNSRPAGLCGLLSMMTRVLALTTASMASRSIRHSGGFSATSRTTPPARRTIGA